MPTVLVVDDEPLIRKMVALVLEQNGFRVLIAGGGPEAIRIWQSHTGDIDLLISDVLMPAMDGPTLAAELRAYNPALPVLLMSGSSGPADDCGRFPFLSKPFSMATLLLAVRCLVTEGVPVPG